MKETQEVIRTSLNVADVNTGEVITIDGQRVINNKYYSIKNLNKRISIMDLFSFQSELCNSSKDIEMFRDFLLEINKTNEFRAVISKFCKENEIDRSRFTKFLKKSLEIGFTMKIERGVYLVNPLVFQSKGSSNALIESAQVDWEELKLQKP